MNSYLDTLPIEIKIEIAFVEWDAFQYFLLNDNEFNSYMISYPKLYRNILRSYKETTTTNEYVEITGKTHRGNTIITTLQGNLHSFDNQPAVLVTRNDNWIFADYQMNDIRHRLDGPAYIDISYDREHAKFEWWSNGFFRGRVKIKNGELTKNTGIDVSLQELMETYNIVHDD